MSQTLRGSTVQMPYELSGSASAWLHRRQTSLWEISLSSIGRFPRCGFEFLFQNDVCCIWCRILRCSFIVHVPSSVMKAGSRSFKLSTFHCIFASVLIHSQSIIVRTLGPSQAMTSMFNLFNLKYISNIKFLHRVSKKHPRRF